MAFGKLSKKARALNKRKEKREYNRRVREDKRIGRDGQKHLIEKYGSAAIFSYRNNAESTVVFFEHQKPAANPLNDPVRKNAKATIVEKAIEAGIRRTGIADEYSIIKYFASQYTSLKSTDWLQEGSSSFGPKTPSEVSWRNMKLVNQIEPLMPPQVRSMMEACFVKNQFLFDDDSIKEVVLDNLRLGLDIIAVEWRQMDEKDFITRWPTIKIYRRF